MNALHVVLGTGPVGITVAEQLARAGSPVRIVSRRGLQAARAGIEVMRADVADAAALRAATRNASVIYNALNPPYHRWQQEWPTLHRHVMDTAAETGAVLVLVDNLYAYGDTHGAPLRPGLPDAATGPKGRVRAEMAATLLDAHRAGRLRAAIARASDFFGPYVTVSSFGERVVPRVLAGRSVTMLGSVDEPHSLTYVPDVARTLVTLAGDARAWGRVWHVPSPPPLTQREAVQALARVAGTQPPGGIKVTALSPLLLRAAGVFSPALRELPEVLYQFTKAWIIDARETEDTFGLAATPFEPALAETVAWYRARRA